MGTQRPDPALADFVRQFEDIKEDARSLVTDLDDAQLTWRLGPERWSIGECLSHLNVTVDLYLPVIEKAIDYATSHGIVPKGPFRLGLVWGWLLRRLEPPARWKIKTLEVFEPPEEVQSKGDLEERFLFLRGQLIERIRRSGGVDLRRTRLVSPASKLVRMNLGQCFGLISTHDRRHLWQARRVMDAPGFPKAGS